MVLSAQSINARARMIDPFIGSKQISNGLSYGLSSAGYDIRVLGSVRIESGKFKLASSLERFKIPNDLLMRVVDKSTWARKGLCVQNTVAEPGWEGYLTLELTNHSDNDIYVYPMSPIAQVIFEMLDRPTLIPYDGKYQDQPSYPVEAIHE